MIGAFSDFADQAVAGPVEISVFLILLLTGRKKDALAWAAVMVAASVFILLLKLWCERCGVPHQRILYSPSGHTMGGTLVYGGLLALMCRNGWIVLFGACALAVGFGLTRVLLQVHTVPEVIVGGMIGVGAVMVLHRLLGQRHYPFSPKIAFLSLMAVLITGFGLHGHRLGAEVWIEKISHILGGYLSCQRA
ncbi:phosphatase PAP2 family protein [Acetobacter sp.]|uniref:phosphatase PAP2 family protein n=1 Tax=Acetobacter sp. TaxID=440 RepID=UPI0025C3D919|nr:phosphatase PAP2 family protein [Acetobacter sp.]MCH4090405.1 phosphatase PAP2 family protein [Acetobacter sp.]MCI1299099.1 phosphatase PAP2 family protein [Acetobacter sp.]MCI1315646.1 phosphatase PAP2 family protein [Acetobacter sp.]